MSFQTDARSYLGYLARCLRDAEESGEATAELSFRSSLEIFLSAVFTSINFNAAVTLEPKRRSIGAPDFRVHDRSNMGVYGFVEAKGPQLGAILSSAFLAEHENQIERYRSLGYRVLVTDGLDFFLFEPGQERPEFASLIDKPCSVSNLGDARINQELYPLLSKFLSAPGFRYLGEQGLVDLTAKHAREIARTVALLAPLRPAEAVNEAERKTITRLHSIHDAVAQDLDPHLRSPESFGGFVAQVLAFSLLYAHRIEHRSANSAIDLYEKLVSWGLSDDGNIDYQLRPFRELIRLLGDELQPGKLGDLGRIYDTLRTTLAYIYLPAQVAETPDYHTLYESFLDHFDHKLRDKYGAYYTPKTVANACVRITAKAIGFENHSLNKVIEPCCGTGSFIEALQEEGITSPITGLEVLPSAYALACFRQSHLKGKESDVQIVLTNTMADELLREEITQQSGQGSLFEVERSEARSAIKPPVVLVIGNPPANDVSTSDRQFCSHIYELLDDFRPVERTSRANDQKQITSTAMQFLRWSAERVLRNGEGAISLLLPSSFIDKPSFKTARRWLRSNFGCIWVLEIDGDARAGAQSNIFQVRQGRALIIAVISDRKEVRYANIKDLRREDKLTWLQEDASKLLRKFSVLENAGETPFKPIAKARSDWERMSPLWRKDGIGGVFAHQCSGIKLAPTSIFVHVRKGVLKRRIQELANYHFDIAAYIQKWFKGQRKLPPPTKFSEKVRNLLVEHSGVDSSYRRYSLRPFLNCWALISEPILKQLAAQPKSGTRFRPELHLIFSADRCIALGITASPEDVSEIIGRPCVLLRHLPDNDLSRRNNIRVVAARSPGNKRGKTWGNLESNIHPKLQKFYSEAANDISLPVEEAVVLYCYAVLSTQWFLDEWSDQLMECTSEELPRVPLPADKSVFLRLVKLGQQLDLAENDPFCLSPDLTGFSEFYLGDYRVVDGLDLELLDANGDVQWVVPGLGAFADFEAGGYRVLSEVLKWMNEKYMKATITTEEVATLYALKTTLETHTRLQPDLTSATRAAVTSEQITLA